MSDASPLQSELKHLGLSDKESAVYLASLELGPSSVQDISHKSKVNRATTYVMIESLSARGLMSTHTKGKKRFYSAESPERLVSIIDHEKKALDEKLGELQKVMPMLNSLYNAEGAKPQVRYLEGVEGIETVRQIFERLDGDFVQIYPRDDVKRSEEYVHGQEKHKERLRNQHERLGVNARKLIVLDDESPTDFDSGIGEARILPRSAFPVHGEITVRGNHVFLFSYKSAVMAAVIISQEIADAVRALFELAWMGAEKYPQQKKDN